MLIEPSLVSLKVYSKVIKAKVISSNDSLYIAVRDRVIFL